MITQRAGLPNRFVQHRRDAGRANQRSASRRRGRGHRARDDRHLALFFQYTRIGRALRAVADSLKAALSVGISLNQIWVIVWFTAGIVALVTGIMWGARSDVSFAQIIALKNTGAHPRRLHLSAGRHRRRPDHPGIGESSASPTGGPLMGGIETLAHAYIIALIFLMCSGPQGCSAAQDHRARKI